MGLPPHPPYIASCEMLEGSQEAPGLMVTQYVSRHSTDVHERSEGLPSITNPKTYGNHPLPAQAYTVQSSTVEVITVVSITVAMHPPTQA